MQRTLDKIRDWHIVAVIILAGAIIYGKSVTYTFTFTDDVRLITLNRDILDSFANIPKLFRTDAFLSVTSAQLFYRPMLNILLMIETQIANGSPAIYHLTNILLHLGCSVLLFRILQQLGCGRIVAGIFALLFCVHPLNTSAVVWIPGQNDILLTLFVLASFSFLLRALETRRISPLVWHFVFFFLALLTKESAVVFPVLTVSYVVLFHRSTLTRKIWGSGLLAYVIIAGIWFTLRSAVPQTFTVHLRTGFFLTSSLHNIPALLLYLGKVFFPFNLSIFPNLGDNSVWLGAASLVILIMALILWRPPTLKHIFWGFGWFILFIAPTLISGFIFFEHRAYSAFFGLLFAFSQFPAVQAFDLSKKAHIAGFGLIVAIFSVIAIVHSEQFRDRTAYATSAYISNPSVDASYANLAELFVGQGNYDDAERVVRKGLARNPAMNTSHRVLADILAHRGNYNQAATEYETSLRLNPLQLNTYIAYGKMCIDAGRPDEAARIWRTSVAVNPGFILGYYYLANFYVHVKNDPDSSMMYVRQIQERGMTVLPELLQAIQECRDKETKSNTNQAPSTARRADE